MKIVLISCVAMKNDYPCVAHEMYVSPLFKGAYSYAKKLNADKIFILSAKYGLLDEDTLIEPYNETLNTKKDLEIRAWADKVFAELQQKTDVKKDEFVFLAGEKYRKYLVARLTNVEIPLKGLGIGKQLAYYKEKNNV